MAINFPGSIDTTTQFPSTAGAEVLVSAGGGVGLSGILNNLDLAVVALETKVGADSSAVTSTHDYKLSAVTGSDKALGKASIDTITGAKTFQTGKLVAPDVTNTGLLTFPTSTDTLIGRNTTDTLTGKTLTSPTINTPTFSAGAVGGADLSTSAIKLGYAQVTANQTGITTQVDLTSLTTTVTVPAGGRSVKITAYLHLQSTVASDYLTLFIMEGATQLAHSSVSQANVANIERFVSCMAVVTPSSGSHTYKLQASLSGTGSGALTAASTDPAFILVEAL